MGEKATVASCVVLIFNGRAFVHLCVCDRNCATKACQWDGGDFGEDVVRSIATLGGGTPSGDAVARLLEDGGDADLVFADYDWSPNDASSSV